MATSVTTTTFIEDENFDEATRTRTVIVQPSSSMRSFFQKHTFWAIVMYVMPFVWIVIAKTKLGIPSRAINVATITTLVALIGGFIGNAPSALNPVIASMPILVFAAYGGATKISTIMKKDK